ncbi:DUF983 domain-containing protein [Sphingomonas sp. HDW15A]|uniref:DUF983 domain-containing protein n=1 Tax=Sphingomonas sp. HDW15A TaxID=2714942 RepID=UPI00140E1DE7|nr:DUF983 domain-containing protein [Sphingomonas sp. HDW15A]QIK95108.1 DUF983 domain-containing protein [Sphingomonas sp. HDW15A]
MTGPTLAGASLKGLCPRCGAKTLFRGPVMLAARCRSCGLDYDAFNVGDGPAAFLILIVGAIVAVAAIFVELSFEPPWWIHAVWLPVGILLTVGGLRLGKAALLYQEYKHQAREGRIGR